MVNLEDLQKKLKRYKSLFKRISLLDHPDYCIAKKTEEICNERYSEVKLEFNKFFDLLQKKIDPKKVFNKVEGDSMQAVANEAKWNEINTLKKLGRNFKFRMQHHLLKAIKRQ